MLHDRGLRRQTNARAKRNVLPESGVKTPISGFERFQPVKLCEYVGGQVS